MTMLINLARGTCFSLVERDNIIFVKPNSIEQLGWSWHINPDGKTSLLQTPMQGALRPEVTYDDTEESALCAEDWVSDTIEVTFTYLDDKLAPAKHAQNADALAKKYMEDAVITTNPGQVIWQPDPAGFDSTMTGVWKI